MANTSTGTRGYIGSRFALEVEHVINGWLYSADGGGPTADVIIEKAGADLVARKHVGNVSYDDIVVECGLGMSQQFYKWITKTLKLDFTRLSGAIHTADVDGKIQKTIEFHHALISEITLPALDASSKSNAKMTLKMKPEYTRIRPLAGTDKITPAAYPSDPTKAKLWLPSNFRLRIDGLDEACARVTKIDALTIKQNSAPLDIGNFRESRLEPTSVTIPDLAVSLPESAAKQFFDWQESFLVKRENDEDHEKNGTLEFLSSDMKTVLLTVTLSHIGIYKVTATKADAASAQALREIKVSMYVEEMQIEFSSDATS